MIEDVKQVVLELGSYMLKLAGKGDDINQNKERIIENIQNGKAFNKFIEMVKNQGGDTSCIEDTNKFERAKYIVPVLSNEKGFVQEINAEKIGELSCSLGAGRINKEDSILKNVGIVLNKKIGDKVEVKEILANIYAEDENKAFEAKKRFLEICKIGDNYTPKSTIILGNI